MDSSQPTHSVVYFASDKSLHVLKTKEVTFTVANEVFVTFPTRNLLDDGREEIVDERYSGLCIFSGSATITRNFIRTCQEEVDFKNLQGKDIVDRLTELAKERKAAGKRGACSKLKRVLAEELNECSMSKKKKSDGSGEKIALKSTTKKEAKKETTTLKTTEKTSEPPPKKIIDVIKLNEMRAFSDVISITSHESTASPSKSPKMTPSKQTTKTTPSKQPTKTTPSKQTTKTTPSKQTTKTTPSKQSTKTTPSKQPTKTTPSKQPTKTTQSKQTTKTTPSKQATTTTPSKQPTKTTPSKQTTKTTPSKQTKKTTPSKQPTKTTPSKQPTKTTQSKQTTKTTPSKQPTKTTPSKQPTKTTQSKQTTKTTPSKQPTKTTPSKQLTKTTPSKQPTKTTQSKQTTKTTPSKQPTKTTPSKQPTKTTQSKQTTKTTPSKQPTKTTPSKQPTKTTPSKQTTKTTPSKQTTKTTPSKQTTKTTQSKQTTKTPPSKQTSKTTPSNKGKFNKAPPTTSTPNSKNMYTGPGCIQLNFDEEIAGPLPDLFSAVRTGLNAVNYDENFSGYGFSTSHSYIADESINNTDIVNISCNNVDWPQNFHHAVNNLPHGPTCSYDPSNTAAGGRSSTALNSYQPTNNSLTDFFTSLDQSQKWAVTGFLERSLHQLQGTSSVSNPDSNHGQLQLPEHGFCPDDSTSAEERKIPLIVDPDQEDHFCTVLVNPAKLKAAESGALTAKNPGAHLLNKTIDLVFSTQELLQCKGVNSLNAKKIEAIQDYLHSKCKQFEVEQVSKKKFMSVMQNKIGNLRATTKDHKMKKEKKQQTS